jgi:hypothetical protein
MNILHAGAHLAIVCFFRNQAPLGMKRTQRRAASEELRWRWQWRRCKTGRAAVASRDGRGCLTSTYPLQPNILRGDRAGGWGVEREADQNQIRGRRGEFIAAVSNLKTKICSHCRHSDSLRCWIFFMELSIWQKLSPRGREREEAGDNLSREKFRGVERWATIGGELRRERIVGLVEISCSVSD